jgi:hypothetical protein
LRFLDSLRRHISHCTERIAEFSWLDILSKPERRDGGRASPTWFRTAIQWKPSGQ